MSSSEFSIIEEFFTSKSDVGLCPVMGVGDDCAIVDVPMDQQLAISTDTLVEGVHFLPNSDPELLGCKVLAVNLSDLAAMGATPAWASLAITLPSVDKAWLARFSKGFFDLAKRHSLQLIGGDTTRGPMSITVNIMGLLPKHRRLTRSGANLGDGIYVSGSIGNAGLGLKKATSDSVDAHDIDLLSYLKPSPKVELGQVLLGMASSCIDISDGLSADLNHILKASGVGATIWHERLPLSNSVKQYMQELGDDVWAYSTGDDYELCFTLPETVSEEVLEKLLPFQVSKIGVIEQQSGLRIKMNGREVVTLNKGFDHFNVR